MPKLYNLFISLLALRAGETSGAQFQSSSDRWIVTLKTEAASTLQHHAQLVAEIHTRNLERRGGTTQGIEKTFDFPGFAGYAGLFDEDTLQELTANPDIAAIEKDQQVFLSALVAQVNPPWGLSAISHADPPLVNASYIYHTSAGEGSFSYVLDSGLFAEHEDYEGRAEFAYDATNGAETDHSHGTHVAGIIGGKTYGVAKKTSLIGVQVTGSTLGQASWILDGIAWTVNDILSKGRIGKAVVNMSVGTLSSTIINEAVKSMIDSGIPVITAAGNFNSDTSDYSPANLPEAITVAASNKVYRRWPASNWGSTVDLFAPGQDIPSTWVGSSSAIYTTSGTSMASPYVAGLAAYLLVLEGPKSPSVLKARILDLATPGLVTDLKEIPNLLLYNGNAT